LESGGLTVFPAVKVNVTTKDLANQGFFQLVYDLLDRNSASTDSLEIEIIESTIMKEPEATIKMLKRFSDTNIIISIDDFGTGYSSLSYLSRIPASIIKIDLSFITNILEDDANQEIVAETINLSHALGFKTIAEGVESESALEMLRSMGCDYAQGFYICHPLPDTEILDFFRDSKWKWKSSLQS